MNSQDSPRGGARGALFEAGVLAGGILLTIHRLSHGGADRVAIHLANGFARAGLPVGLATLRSGGEGEAILRGLLDNRVLFANAGRPMGLRHLELARGFHYIRGIVEHAEPAVVLATSNNMGLITGLAADRRSRKKGTSYVLKTTNPVVRPFDQWPVRKLYRRLLYDFVFSRFDRILTLSAEEQGTLAQIYPHQRRKFRLVANPYVTSEMLIPGGSPHHLGGPMIVTLARMMPQKRLDILIRAFAKLPNEDCRLTILGDGPARPKLEALSKALGVARRVAMPGFTEEVIPYLREANLFALSSDYEGWPAAVFEALASRVPVVSTNCFDGAWSLLAKAPRCAVVPIGDVEALASAMRASLSSSEDITSLSGIAAGYGIEAGVVSHLRALSPLIDKTKLR
jgi:glycosyltransferase involved in cell wall biosynthesis